METSDGKNKLCRYCGEEIPADSGRCQFCGSLLDEKTASYSVPRGKGSQVTLAYISDPLNDSEPAMAEEQNTEADYGKSVHEPVQAEEGQEQVQEPAKMQEPEQEEQEHRKALSNAKKVFTTMICTLIPGIGQLVGVIIGIILSNIEGDEDRNSFGRALLVSSVFAFLVSCIGYFLIVLAFMFVMP